MAIFFATGSWTYVSRVLIAYQIADAAAHGRPRGNLSDLYPRWLGARELLLHGRDPYGPDVTRDIQQGYYGRSLDASHPADPSDQQRFAYPLYVVFCVAPFIHQSFGIVRSEAFWILLGLTIVSVLLWVRVLQWNLSVPLRLAIVILTVGNLPVVQGLKLQQLTLFVSALIGVAVWALSAERPVVAGAVLALGTIKPQLVGIFLLWLLVWTSAKWRMRYRWLLSFVATLAALFVASEYVLPRWLPRFLHALRDYSTYTDSVSVLGKLIPGPWNGLALLLTAAATAWAGWNHRHDDLSTAAFAETGALVMATTVVIIPTYGLYNQLLLVPALLCLARDFRALWRVSLLRRVLVLLTGFFMLWPWAVAVALASASFVLPAEAVERAWAVPFWTALMLPVAVAALMLVAHFSTPFPARKTAGAS